jgi:hypothetical protein
MDVDNLVAFADYIFNLKPGRNQEFAFEPTGTSIAKRDLLKKQLEAKGYKCEYKGMTSLMVTDYCDTELEDEEYELE